MRARTNVAAVLLFLLLPAAASAQALTQKQVLTYEGARQVAEAAEEEALENGWDVTIVVVDDAAVPLYVKRMDGASRPTYDVALGKARASVSFARPSADLDFLRGGGISLPGIMPIQGGLPIVVDGEVAGAVAASGVTSEQDEQIARAGVQAISGG